MRADSLHAAPVFQMLMVSALALVIGVSGHHLKLHPSAFAAKTDSVNQDASAEPSPAVVAKIEAMAAALPPENVTREAEIDDGQDFSDMLGDAGVNDNDATAAMNALAQVYPLKK